ncbi:PKD domain-containing protein [Candidatus Magnetomoraceae bacterium gMMP-15]
MKRNYIFCLLLFLTFINVDLSILFAENNFRLDEFREMFEDLDKKEISTGILYDKVIPFSKIENFTGDSNSKTSSLKNWKQMYFEMRRGSLKKPIFPNINIIKTEARKRSRSIRRYIFEDVIPIGIMNFKYNALKSDVLEKGLISIEKKRLRRTRRSTESPYEEKRVFAASALKEKTYRGHNITFFIDKKLYFSNDDKLISNIELDFDDGKGYRELNFDDRININYSVPGTKILKLKSYYEDKNILESSFLFDVKSLTTPDPNETWNIQGRIPYKDKIASGKAYIYRSANNDTLKNPIIVVEGFDIENTKGWDELYNLLSQQNLSESIRKRGYDLIVLDFDDSTDYIQRNAYLLIELIKKINAVKTSDNRMTILGASMGGLVSRYALSYMEKNGIPHNTKNFISFDSPQRGANIPLGIQYWLSFFASENDEADSWIDKLNTPAAKQMLVYHYNSSKNNYDGYNCIDSLFCYSKKLCSYIYTADSDSLRKEFVKELIELDYPQQLRKIAISNGSGYSIGQPFKPGDQIIRYYLKSFLVDILGNAYALPNNNYSKKVFHGELDKWGPSCNGMINIIESKYSYDNAPGGMRDTNKQIADSSTEGKGDITTTYPNHCFIPTISALDINTTNLYYNISEDSDIMNKTPFDKIYFPSINEDHVAITAENSEWIINEIIYSECENCLKNAITALKILTGVNIFSYNSKCVDINRDNKVDMRDVIFQLHLISKTK